jgi:hypothetical protein
MAYRYDLIIEQGASMALDIDCQDEGGTVCDLTGCSASAQVRVHHGDTDPVAVFLASVSPTLGRISLRLSPMQTGALGKAYGVWDARLSWPDGTVQRLAEGKVTVKPEVTR